MKAFLALVAAIVVPSFARAADLPVTYTVEEKPLKAAVAGTPLTFELYTDSACSGPVAHSEVVNIEDAELLVKLKPFNPKNATKRPATVEIRSILTEGVPALDANPYLKVTGTGIMPVGGVCQVQSAPASQGGALPTINTTLRHGDSNSGRGWEIENWSSVGLPSPTDLIASDRRTALKLQALDPTLRYGCSVEVVKHATFDQLIQDNSGGHVPVYGLDCLVAGTNCGDSVVIAGETCDPPGQQSSCASGFVCNSSCSGCQPVCGDGIVVAGESCDPPGGTSGCSGDETCTANCSSCISCPETTIPDAGGTLTGSTDGGSKVLGSCGLSSGAPERTFSWTPSTSGTATIETCGGTTNFDTVVYIRAGSCNGTELACNDDIAGCVGSRITPTVTAGQTYVIVVDGFASGHGNFTLTVIPPP